MKKLRTSYWPKTSAFSCNTRAKFNTSAKLQHECILHIVHRISSILNFRDVFSCTLLTSNDIISFAIWCNKHLQILQRQQIAILLSLKNLLALVNFKLHSKSWCYPYVVTIRWHKVTYCYLFEMQRTQHPSNTHKRTRTDALWFALLLGTFPWLSTAETVRANTDFQVTWSERLESVTSPVVLSKENNPGVPSCTMEYQREP